MATAPPKGNGNFPTTEWTLIARLRHEDELVCARALDELCAQYHYPLYCFIRRGGLAHHDAEDALHDFLVKLLRLEAFHDRGEEKGRLRTYLSKALDRFLITRHHRESRRTGREVSVDDARFTLDPEVEQRYAREVASVVLAPDVMFDRQWCEELLTRVLNRLRVAFEQKGKAELFAALRPVLLAGGSLRGHDTDALAAQLSMSTNAVRTTLLRLLREFRALLKEEVRQTVGAKEDVMAEIAHLMRVLGREAGV
jgi:DNA-directed RNA polymerase specialized sigma24 family protein